MNPRLIIRMLLGVALAKVVLAGIFLTGPRWHGWIDLATASPAAPPVEAPVTAEPQATDGNLTTPNPKIVEVLKARLRTLDAQQTELDQRAKDLDLLQSSIEDKVKELDRLQRQLEGPAKQAQAAADSRFEHLVGVYSSMEPARAAALLEKMDEGTVIKMFSMMKSRKVADILAFMGADKAARISAGLSQRKLP